MKRSLLAKVNANFHQGLWRNVLLQTFQVFPHVLFVNTNEVRPHEERSIICVVGRAQENLSGGEGWHVAIDTIPGEL